LIIKLTDQAAVLPCPAVKR